MPHRTFIPSVLTLSGSDPSGGAGLEADLKVFHQHGVFGMAIATLLTVQNAKNLRKIHCLNPDFVEEQWHAIFDVTRPTAIKIGALGSRSMVRCIAELISRPEARGIPVVLDPVMGSTSGLKLLEPSALPDLKSKLLPLCRLITPNAREFFTLAEIPFSNKHTEQALKAYASGKVFSILLKGGHFQGPHSIDLLWDKKIIRLTGKRLAHSVHGTGCALASSIAAHLAKGYSLPESCRRSKAYVAKALASALKQRQNELDFWVGI